MNYYWKDGKVHTFPHIISIRHLKQIPGILHCPIYDPITDKARYPESTTGCFRDFDSGWYHIPWDEFPAEFKAHLLLMGIT